MQSYGKDNFATNYFDNDDVKAHHFDNYNVTTPFDNYNITTHSNNYNITTHSNNYNVKNYNAKTGDHCPCNYRFCAHKY